MGLNGKYVTFCHFSLLCLLQKPVLTTELFPLSTYGLSGVSMQHIFNCLDLIYNTKPICHPGYR